MTYRHAFHAGNFADLAKHAILLTVLKALRPRRVLDTHAGAGLYDLQGEDARRTGEADRGAARLMADPAPPGALADLQGAVRRANPRGGARWYPGSPRLAVDALPAGATYTGFELDRDAHAALARALRPPPGVRGEAVRGDGYAEAARRLATPVPGPTLLLVDPPFERADDYDRATALVGRAARVRDTGALIWLPIKDLETFDAALGRIEARRPVRLYAAQVRLRPLDDPLRLNGCALVLANLPDLDSQAMEVCDWVARSAGEPGAVALGERLA